MNKILQRRIQMPTNEKISEILDFIKLNESIMTTHQLFNHFEKKDQLKVLVYAFPFMVKGHVLAFETLLSKEVVKQAYIERPENINKDIIESMSGRQY